MLIIDEAIAFERQQAKDKRNEHYTFGIQKSKEAAEEHEQLAEWLEELKALRLLLDWAIECDFGLDSFPEEYEKYKHTLTDDMTYKDMMIQIAKCVVAEEIKEQNRGKKCILNLVHCQINLVNNVKGKDTDSKMQKNGMN